MLPRDFQDRGDGERRCRWRRELVPLRRFLGLYSPGLDLSTSTYVVPVRDFCS